jgi:hypothetical protein
MHNRLLAVSVALTETKPGDGGFCIIRVKALAPALFANRVLVHIRRLLLLLLLCLRPGNF